MTVRREVLLVVLLVLLAAALRVFGLGDLPPGLFTDEAFYGLDAWRVAHHHWHPIFFEGNFGREPLYIYLEAIAVLVLGPQAGTLRLVAALVSTGTALFLYLLGRELFDWRTGFLAALTWAAGFPTLLFGRLGFRANTLPLLEAITLWLLVLALRRLSRNADPWRTVGLSFGLAGLALGLTMYTYLASRAFPPVALILALHWGLAHRPSKHRFLMGLIVFVGVAALVFAPLAAYFLSAPRAFTVRMEEVTVHARLTNDPYYRLLKIIGGWGMFFVQGSSDPMHNLPDRPILDPPLASCCLVGLLVCARRLRSPACALLPLWFVLLTLPDILTSEPPDALRVIGALPAVCLLVGLGATTVWRWLERRWPQRWPAIPALGISAVFFISAVSSIWLYFAVWAQLPAVAAAYDAPETELAGYVNRLGEQGEGVYVPLSAYGYPTITFLTRGVFPQTRGMPPEGLAAGARRQLLIPPYYDRQPSFVLLEGGVAYVLPPLDAQAIADLQARLPQSTTIPGRYGAPLALIALPIPPTDDPFPRQVEIARPLRISLEGQIKLLGYDLGAPADARPRLTPGDYFPVTLYWQALRPLSQDYVTFVHALSPDEQVVGGWDGTPGPEVFPTSLWRPDDVVATTYQVPIKPGLPPGKYTLEVGLFHPYTGVRLDMTAADGTALGSRVLLGPLKVPANDAAPVGPPALPTRANFGGLVALAGCDVTPASLTVRPGQSIRVALHWRGLALTDTDYTVFVHLADVIGHPVAQHDGPPRTGRYPTSIWDAGEAVLDEHEFPTPTNLAPGVYRLIAGLYDPVTWARLPVLDDAGQPSGDHVVLTTIEVQP